MSHSTQMHMRFGRATRNILKPQSTHLSQGPRTSTFRVTWRPDALHAAEAREHTLQLARHQPMHRYSLPPPARAACIGIAHESVELHTMRIARVTLACFSMLFLTPARSHAPAPAPPRQLARTRRWRGARRCAGSARCGPGRCTPWDPTALAARRWRRRRRQT